MLALRLLFKKTDSFCLALLEDSCHLRTTLLRSPCCGKPEPQAKLWQMKGPVETQRPQNTEMLNVHRKKTPWKGSSHPAAPT